MTFELSPEHRDLALAALAALSVFAAALVVSWPYVFVDSRAERLKRLRDERELVRLRERANLAAVSVSLKHGQGSPIGRFFARLRGLRGGEHHDLAEVFQVARMLRTAGYRDQGAIVTYMAMQVVAPLVLCAGVALWAYGLAPETPAPLTQAALFAVAAIAGHFAPRIFVENQISKRREAILKIWPDALDLMLICIEAGIPMEQALNRVAEEMAGQSPELSSELNICTAELAYLQDRAQALRNLGERTGLHSVRSVVSSLIQSEKYGTSLANSLRVVSQEQRDQRLIEAEKKAAALPPKLTVPMILFFLPVLFVVILTPAAIRIMGVD